MPDTTNRRSPVPPQYGYPAGRSELHALAIAGVLALALVAGLATLSRGGEAPPPVDDVPFRASEPFTVNVGGAPLLQSFTLANVNTNDDDGDLLDLITVEQDQGRINVYLGRGGDTGNFELVATPQVIFPPGDGDTFFPTVVAVTDVSSPFAGPDEGRPDGEPDILVGGEDGELVILLGKGDGQFDAAEQNFDEGDFDFGTIGGFALGNFDEQGATDVAVLDQDGSVTFLCNADGTLEGCGTEVIDLEGLELIDIVSATSMAMRTPTSPRST